MKEIFNMNIKNMFHTKRFKYGTFSALTTLVVIVISILINLIVSQLNLKYDLTTDQKFSLTKETKDILQALDEDITIYALFPTGEEIPIFNELIDQYQVLSNKIKVVYKDPVLYPAFLQKYQKNEEAIEPSSIIVDSGARFKVIKSSELISYKTVQTETAPYYKEVADLVNIEPRITNAIQYVTRKNISTIYYITGHNEMTLSESYVQAILDSGNHYSLLDLSLGKEIPKDTSALIITNPLKDYSGEETEKILEYLRNNGRVLFVLDYMPYKLDHFNQLLVHYGLKLGSYFVRETNPNFSFANDERVYTPQIAKNEINESFISRNLHPILFQTNTLEKTGLKKATITYTPLLTTTQDAFAKNDADATSIHKEAGDISGPFDIALAVTDRFYVGNHNFETKLIVISTSSVLDDKIDGLYAGGANSSFIVNCLNSFSDAEPTTYISPKSLQSTAIFQVSTLQYNLIFFGALIAVPILLVSTGITVWFRRRNK